jgi:hypothetical protein
MCNNHSNPTQCILPPYIADQMKDISKLKKEESLDNELRNYRFRNDRNFFSAILKVEQKILAVKKAKIKKLNAIAPLENPTARDDFYHSIIINGKKLFQ